MIVAVSIVLLVDVVVRGSVLQAVLIAPWLLLVLWVAHVVWFASSVSTDADGITVQNALRRTRVPWGRVTGVELRWQLKLALDDGSTVRSFGGPSPTRRGIRRARTGPDGATEQTGEIVDDWIAAAKTGGGPVRHSWDIPAVVALGVIMLWLAVAVVVAAS